MPCNFVAFEQSLHFCRVLLNLFGTDISCLLCTLIFDCIKTSLLKWTWLLFNLNSLMTLSVARGSNGFHLALLPGFTSFFQLLLALLNMRHWRRGLFHQLSCPFLDFRSVQEWSVSKQNSFFKCLFRVMKHFNQYLKLFCLIQLLNDWLISQNKHPLLHCWTVFFVVKRKSMLWRR